MIMDCCRIFSVPPAVTLPPYLAPCPSPLLSKEVWDDCSLGVLIPFLSTYHEIKGSSPPSVESDSLTEFLVRRSCLSAVD